MAGEKAAKDHRLPPRAEAGAARLHPLRRKLGRQGSPPHQQVVQGIVDGVELGAGGGEREGLHDGGIGEGVF
jgi:hypothetical protein